MEANDKIYMQSAVWTFASLSIYSLEWWTIRLDKTQDCRNCILCSMRCKAILQ